MAFTQDVSQCIYLRGGSQLPGNAYLGAGRQLPKNEFVYVVFGLRPCKDSRPASFAVGIQHAAAAAAQLLVQSADWTS